MDALELQEKDELAWDEYVQNTSLATPFHLVGWKRIMERTYGYRSHYLMAKEAGRIEGALPLLEVKSWILGDYVTSLCGGICTENAAAAQTLIERAKAITRKVGAKSLIFRDSRRKWGSGLATAENHCTLVLNLPPNSETLWQELDRRVRWNIRTGLKKGAQVSVEAGHIEKFYTLFCVFTRDMGTPVFSYTFLRNAVAELPDHFLVISLEWQGRVVGSIWAFTMGGCIYCTWGASLHDDYDDLRPNYLLFWNSIRYGCEQGYHHFDFGRSRQGSGQYEFKRRWGSQTVPLYQQWWPADSQVMVDPSEKIQMDAKFRIFVKTWQRLPVPLAQWMGPKLRRHLPFA